jgi:hypothetical protein
MWIQAFPDMEEKSRERCIQNAKKSTIIMENMVNNIGMILMSREHKKLSKAQLTKQAAKNVVSSGQNGCSNNNDDKDKEKKKDKKRNNRTPNDDDDWNESEHPYGKYDDADYHHPNSSGRKSPCPDNGQEALDNSIESPSTNSKRRYGVDNSGQFVVFDQTRPGLYHSHIVTWKEITEVKELAKKMIQAQLATKTGKAIIRVAKSCLRK